MSRLPHRSPVTPSMRRRDLLQVGLSAAAVAATWTSATPTILWAAEAGQPKRGGTLRVRGWDPPHFDHHQTLNFKTNTTVSLAHSTLVRYKVGPDVRPGTFTVEPHLAERWEQVDDLHYVFHLRKGVKWHNKPPVNGREFVAEDVKFTFDRFQQEPSNPLKFMLEPLDHVEVVDRHTVKFVLKEPFVWLVHVLANPIGTWIIAPEVVQQFGDLKKSESLIGTGPFMLESYEPNVKAVFKRNPDYFLPGQPYIDGVEWLIIDDLSTGLALYRTGKIDCASSPWWTVEQPDVEALKKSNPQLKFEDFVSNVTSSVLYMRTDMPPFNDVRVRRAMSMAVDRQAIIDGVYLRGVVTPAIARGATEWSLPIDQLGEGARYYQYDPKEAKRLLAEAGHPKGFKTTLSSTGGYGPNLPDVVQLVQRNLKDVGVDAEIKMQEYGAYMATTFQGKYEGLAMGPLSITWEPDSPLAGLYMPDQPRNSGHVNDPKVTAMLKEQRRTVDMAARKQILHELQRYLAQQQYYIYTTSLMLTGSWQPYVKNYAPNLTFDYGSRVAALWLER